MMEKIVDSLGGALENMVQIMMTAFPDSWPEADRRELALKQLGMLEDVE